ncbi:MAG: ankyrin repeat domain-containing protein [Planctomycetia bacterium]|nr:ankyrin repeat domain-containing protein [Planctomycetia bacterium]
MLKLGNAENSNRKKGIIMKINRRKIKFFFILFLLIPILSSNLYAENKEVKSESFPFSFASFLSENGKLENAFLVKVLIMAGADPKEKIDDKTLLFFAGTGQVAQILIDAGVDVSSQCPVTEATALYCAPNAQVAECLIRAGADVNVRAQEIWAPIHTSMNGDVVEVLLKAGAKLKDLKISPLFTAMDAKSVRLLVQAGEDVNTQLPITRITPIFVAHNAEILQALLDAGAKSLVEASGGRTPLHYINEPEVMELLLKEGLDPNVHTAEVQSTPLHVVLCGDYVHDGNYRYLPYICDEFFNSIREIKDECSWCGGTDYNDLEDEDAKSLRLIELLLKAGADINAKNICGETPIMFANNAKITKFLLEHGADVKYISNSVGVTPLHMSKDGEMTQLLLSAGADARAQNIKGQTPLHYAPDGESVRLLLAAGADPCHEDENGEVPLFYAPDGLSVQLLIDGMKEKGVDMKTFLNKKSPRGFYPMLVVCDRMLDDMNEMETESTEEADFISEESLYDVLQIFLREGADVNQVTEDGRTVAFNACTKKTLELLKKYGADFSVVDAQGNTLLHNSYYLSEDAVRFLVGENVNVNAINLENETALTCLSRCDTDKQKEMVKILLKAGAEPNPIFPEEDAPGSSPLHICRDPEVLKLLIEAGADVNAVDSVGNTPIFYMGDYPESIKLLLEAGADVTVKNKHGETLLFYSEIKSIESLKALHGAGLDIMARNNEGNTFLMDNMFPSYKRFSKELLEYLFDSGYDVNITNHVGRTLLHSAQDPELVKFCIHHGADVNAKDRYQKTPLHYFRSIYGYEIVKLLLEAGAGVHEKDLDGRTPLFYVENPETIQLMMDYGAKVDGRDFNGFSVLHSATMNQEAECVKLLLKLGVDPNVQDDMGQTPLFMAEGDVISLLLEYGANVNFADVNGHTALFEMIWHFDSVKVLLEAGADVNFRDAEGKTPIFYVDDKEVYDLLIAAGADPNIRDFEGELPEKFFAEDFSSLVPCLGEYPPNYFSEESGMFFIPDTL